MISIPQILLDEISAHARRGAPDEVCGWLAGNEGVISKVSAVPNVAPNARVTFKMEPAVQISTMRGLREEGLEILGTYHSHPRTTAVPSSLDAQLAAYPEAVHVIISLARMEPEFRLYRVTGGEFSPIPLRRIY